MSREAMKQALEAMKSLWATKPSGGLPIDSAHGECVRRLQASIEALRAALASGDKPSPVDPVAQPAGEPASMQTGSPLRAAFDVWWDGEHDWGGSTQAACMAAFKAGAAAARVPLTDSQLDRAVEAWFASDAPNGSADFEHDSDARFRARMRAAIEAAGQEGGAA